MEASSVFIKTEIEDAEYERSYNYSSNDTLVNNEEDYTVTVNPEAVLDIKYEREEDPTSNNSESIAAFSSNASGLTGDNDVSDSLQPKEPPVHKEVNRRKRKLIVRRLDARQIEETCEENEESAMVSQAICTSCLVKLSAPSIEEDEDVMTRDITTKIHVAETSEVADHCRRHALSDDSTLFSLQCSHSHNHFCESCEQIKEVVRDVKQMVNQFDFTNRDDKDDIIFRLMHAELGISSWKSHLLRAKNQEEAKQEVFKSLSSSSACIVLDWAMKFLPRKYREDSQDWFGKRGISWHVAVVFTKDDEILKGLTYLHIFDGQISQDASVTTAVILDVVKSLNQQYPDITTIHLWSDNAGCYKSSETISTIYHHCKAVHSFDFCEAQDGKGACDRTAAVIKANIRRFVNEGHDVVTARDMKQAIEKTSKNVQYRVKVVGVETTERQKFKPIPSISTFNNFKFLDGRLQVWRHYGIGVVKTEPEEFSTIWNSEDTNSFDGTAIKMENNDNGLGSDSNYMEGGSNGTTEVAPGEDFVIKTESESLEDESSAYSNHVQSTSKRKRRSLEENSDAFQNVPVGNLMSLQEFEGDASKSIRGRNGNRSTEAKEKTRKTWFLDEDKGMWKRRSWYEEEAKNMMQKTQEDLKQIEELYSSKSSGKSKEMYISILQSSAEKPETKENKREVKRLVGRKRSRYEEKTELMKRKTEEDEEFIGSLKTMFKRPADTSEHSNQSIDSTSSPPESGASENCDKSAILSTSLLTLTELSELNERRRGSNKVPIEEDKWKELSRKSSEELEQEIAELNGKRRLTVPRKSMYEEKTRDMNRKTQEDEELIKGLQSLRKLVSKDSKEYKQLLSDTSVLSESIKEQVEISPNTFEYQPGPGVPVKKIVMPTENSLTYLIPQRWESDEALGDMAEYAPVLYSNKKHPDLKEKIPQWNLRAPMIAKIWRDLPEHTREAYKAQCKQNKLKKEEDQKKMLEEELKKHSSKKPKQSRGSDIAYRASVPATPIAPVRQSQRLMSKSINTATAADMKVKDSPERSSSPGSGNIDLRRSKYAEKAMMLNMKSERDKAMMAEANLPVPRDGPSDRLPGSHYALSMQMMALKTRQEMATLAQLIPQEKVAAIQSRQAIIPKDQIIEEEIEENPPPTVYVIDHGKLVQARLNGNQRTSDSPPVQKDVNLNQNSVFYVRKSRYNEEPEKSVVMEESVLMCSECGEEFTSVSDMDSHKTLSHNYKPSVVLPKEDTALPFIKFEPVDEDFDKIENSSCYAEVNSSKERKKKSKGKLKVKVGKSRKKSSDEAQTNCGTCDTDIKIKTEVL